MRNIRRWWRRLSLYKKSLCLFSLVMLLLTGIFLSYIYNSLVLYERNLTDNYINYLLSSGKIVEDIKDDLFEVSPYEKNNAKISEGVKEIFKDKNIKIKKNTKLSKDDIFAYDLYKEDKLISTISLKNVNTYKRMAILTINEWNVLDIKTYFKEGIYSYKISVPSNYEVKVNGKTLGNDVLESEGDVSGLERLTEYVEIEKSKHYNLTNLVFKPDIKIYDENKKEVQFQEKDGNIVVAKEFVKVNTLEDAKKYLKVDFDIMNFAQNYSLFLTDDLKGNKHGFDILSSNLIENSYMYNMAYSWATSVDITFVSSHYLKNPVFTNQRLENFVIYNDVAFSVEVYLEKNMVVSGKTKVDIMHDRLYFIYYNDGYKLVNMEALN